MCGIAGVLSPILSKDSLKERSVQMSAAMHHRGPDGCGTFVFPGGSFGHVRLAIVDLSDNAAQPMTAASGRSTVAFNGEIYNHKVLRKELESFGHAFRTQSDTEVILAAYEHWGTSFVDRLNGMFAFALHDAERKKVILARDRLGIKPLYWEHRTNLVTFASEIKAVRIGSQRALSVDQQALLEYLSFQNHLGCRTLFSGIELFPAAHIAVIDLDSMAVQKHRYWSSYIEASDESESHLRDKLSTCLNLAVSSQMAADVPVSSFLSGGIDSAAIATLGARSSGRLKTFTCGFSLFDATPVEQGFDERRVAELVSKSIGSEHYETVLHADDFIARMDDWAWHAEEPRVGSSFPNFCVSYLASHFTKVCMSGTGGDELFAGYPWRYQAASTANGWDSFSSSYFAFWHRMIPRELFNELTAPLNPVQFDSYELFRSHLDESHRRVRRSTDPYIDAALLFEMDSFLHGLLIVEDKATMASGLEVRVPLLDNTVVQLALSTPIRFKLGVESIEQSSTYGSNGQSAMPSFSNGKRILRDVLSKHVPLEVSTGRKQGFSPPFETWFRNDLRAWIENEVLGPSSCLNDYLDLRPARRIIAEHMNGHGNHRLFVWGLISLYLSVSSFMRRCNQ